MLIIVPLSEPEQTEHTTDAHVFFDHIRNGHACIQELLSTIIANTRHETRWFTNQTEFLFCLL